MSSVSVSTLHDHGHHDDGSKTTVGFWIYLMSDCLIFATLFATFGVLANATAGGPGGRQLFDLPFVLGETALLLVSSFTFGVAMLNLHGNAARNKASMLCQPRKLRKKVVLMEISRLAPCTPSRLSALALCCT